MPQDAAPKPRTGFDIALDLGGDVMITTGVITDAQTGDQYAHLTLDIHADPAVQQDTHTAAVELGRHTLLIDDSHLDVAADTRQVTVNAAFTRDGLDALIEHLTTARLLWASSRAAS